MYSIVYLERVSSIERTKRCEGRSPWREQKDEKVGSMERTKRLEGGFHGENKKERG